jgi:hypothetical protein
MESIELEKEPKVAIYTPPTKQPWDDAVTLVLTYAEIPYEKVFDEEVIQGRLHEYDWLHLHHEDFTGQYSKFYTAYRNAPWYIQEKMSTEAMTKRMGFKKVAEEKKAVSLMIRRYVEEGGFLFAMCLATNTLDIALATQKTDVADVPFDGDPVDPNYRTKMDYTPTFAFTGFFLETDANFNAYDNIDVNRVNIPWQKKEDLDFTLFEFSAKWDPVPTMLTQNHVNLVKGFLGLTTSFHRAALKKSVIAMGEVEGTDRVKYIHGNAGKGQFTFFGGHDPEDYSHLVGDPPTDLTQHKNSPGYRIILNNVLFPAARQKKKKT